MLTKGSPTVLLWIMLSVQSMEPPREKVEGVPPMDVGKGGVHAGPPGIKK